MRRFAIAFAIAIGAGMLGWWALALVTGQVPEVATEPVRLAFHLAAEALTAVTLIAGGFGTALRRTWARTVYLVGLGMLFYTVVVSPGYFAQIGQVPLAVMFAVFGAGGLVALRWVTRSAAR